MNTKTISIFGEYIELHNLLKVAKLVGTSGQGKEMVRNSEVMVDGVLATEMRKKIRPGNIVECRGIQLGVVISETV